jgi:hypothetical protein
MTFAVTNKVEDTFEITDVNADGSLWEAVLTVEQPQVEYVSFYWDYTKGSSTNFVVGASFEDKTNPETYYNETEVSTQVGSTGSFTWTLAGQHRYVVPVTMSTTRVKFTIVPDVATGIDTLVLHGNANTTMRNV